MPFSVNLDKMLETLFLKVKLSKLTNPNISQQFSFIIECKVVYEKFGYFSSAE